MQNSNIFRLCNFIVRRGQPYAYGIFGNSNFFCKIIIFFLLFLFFLKLWNCDFFG